MLGFCSALYLFIGIIPMMFFVEGVNFRSAKDSIGMTSMERYMRRSRFEAHDVFQSNPPIHHNAIIAKNRNHALLHGGSAVGIGGPLLSFTPFGCDCERLESNG